ncbi:NACHT, LRR and PYD domains-containing protein 3-like isoform X2 [Ambystoma mexicanum]|uniref:NACHT, LRR and PYD domains-containing protein 3-like isoform X2 n=1 Tax=Ambystoma mexicanum TaxID=8296 RepID=UPI0037E881C9
MAGEARRILFSHFKELEEKDLQKCKSLLENYPPAEGSAAGSRRWGKKASYIELADRMIRDYQGVQALEVAVELLRDIDQKDLSDCLVESSKTYLHQRRCEKTEQINHRRKYMDDMIERVRLLESKINISSKCFQLETKYTKLLLINNQYRQATREFEIMTVGSNHPELMAQQGTDTYLEVSRLFEPDEHGNIPRVITLQGAAGIGKTTTALKILQDWASGELFEEQFDYAFYIPCREVVQLPGEQTFADLLYHSYLEMPNAANGPKVDPKKLLFIVDGFDELRCPLLLLEMELHSTRPKENIRDSFMRKTIFDKSYIIITTRPNALNKLSAHVKTRRVVQILGFSQDDQKEYFQNYFGRQILAKSCNIVPETEFVFAFCFVPVVCWMVCTAMKYHMDKGIESSPSLKTLSSVYLSFLENVLKKQKNDSLRPMQFILKKICALAWAGVWEQKVLFKDDDLIKHSLTVSEIQSLFFKTHVFQKVSDSPPLYKFIHPNFQEFLAALFYLLEDTEENAENLQQDLIGCLEMSRKYEHSQLKFTVRFLFGLLNDENQDQMENRLKLKLSTAVKCSVLMWIKEQIQEGPCEIRSDLMDLLYCLYEYRDEEFVKEAIGHFKNMDMGGINSDLDVRVLQFCLEKTSVIEKFHISNTKMRPERLEALMPWLRTCSSLRLWSCKLTASCCTTLSSVLSANPSLMELDLGFNEHGDAGVRQLCHGLMQPGCRLEKVDFRRCLLTDSCCAGLATVLRTSPSLVELSLQENDLLDSGIRDLCDGLTHPACKLKKLDLWGCSLTESCSGHLASALSLSRCLSELILGNNRLGDSGAKELCEGLRHPGCRLQKLEMDRCSLTESSCAYFSSVFRVNQHLVDLDLADNELGDSGVAQLCEGLRRSKLQTLGLRCCSLTGSCLADISSLLCTPSSLTALDLGGNALSDLGVKQLCEGLKHPACRIRTLKMWSCSITGFCCADLSSAVGISPSLVELDLSDNELGDCGVSQLSEGLKHADCKMQKLCLDDAKLSDGCIPSLCTAVSESRNLQKLSLRWNLLTDISIAPFIQLTDARAARMGLKLKFSWR